MRKPIPMVPELEYFDRLADVVRGLGHAAVVGTRRTTRAYELMAPSLTIDGVDVSARVFKYRRCGGLAPDYHAVARDLIRCAGTY